MGTGRRLGIWLLGWKSEKIGQTAIKISDG